MSGRPKHRCLAALTTAVIAATMCTAASKTIHATQDDANIADIWPLAVRPAGDESGIWWAHLSGNGKTAFAWTRSDLIPGLPPGDGYRMFAIDVGTGQVRLVVADGKFQPEAVSYDGRIVVGSYEYASDQHAAVVVDSVTGAIRALDVGIPMTFFREAQISTDGTTVAFAATTGLGETLSPLRLFIADIASGQVSEPLAGADGDFFHIRLSGDGTVVAFSSSASNLAMPVGNRGADAVVYDRVAGTIVNAFSTTDGDVPDDQSVVEALSDDGSTVFIRSAATNLGGSAEAGVRALYRFDRNRGTTTWIDVPTMPTTEWSVHAQNADATTLALSGLAGGTPVLFDVEQGTVTSLYPGGVEPDGGLWTGALDPISIDAAGRTAVFLSTASNLGPDGDSATDAFVVGAARPDPAGTAYFPPEHQLPPTEISTPTVVPPTIPAPPTTTTPAPPPTSAVEEPTLSRGPDVDTKHALLGIACAIDRAFDARFIRCDGGAVSERVVAMWILVSLALGAG